jgi:signal transduction histidine kinase
MLDEKGRACCTQIMKTAEQIGALVDDTNAYIATKEASLHLRVVNANEVIENIREEFSSRLEDRTIKWTVNGSPPEIIADKLALTRAFRNLVENALKYGGRDLEEICIRYRQDGDFHVFSFRDNGVGIKREDREKVFEIFQRNETSRGTSGAGLGLAIVREVALRHQGNAWIDPKGGKDLTVCVSISKDLQPNND